MLLKLIWKHKIFHSHWRTDDIKGIINNKNNPNGAHSPNRLSFQLVIVSWSGKSKCTLLELDPVSIFPVIFCPVMDKISSVFFKKLGQFPIQKRVSSGPEVAIPKAKALFRNCVLLDETGWDVLLLSELESKKSSRRVSSASKKIIQELQQTRSSKILASRVT